MFFSINFLGKLERKENVMRKICMLVVMVMLMTFAMAAQAEVRSGGLPELKMDNNLKDCNCRLFPQCCEQPVVEAPAPPPPPPAPVPAPEPPPPPPPSAGEGHHRSYCGI